ncbi:hypothetical protein N431DRAFT_558718 [Stipitochalara longipes BDJ]|nr:hypothetical protein N431DRAFT_558718 [Stipitochalara longipes BDJ]
MQRVATSELPPAQARALARGPASRWIRPLEPKASIFLGIRPVEGIGREVRDALLEYTDPQQAAEFVFSSSPASTLSQEWRIIVVSEDTAHCYEIDAGAMLIPTKPQSWRALTRSNLAWRYPRIGYTVHSVEEITKQAVKISWPMKYSLYSENSQKFAYRLFEAIRQPNQPPTVSDVLSGLDRIPEPFRTLNNRCQAVVLTVLVSLQKRSQAAAKNAIGVPVTTVVKKGIWVIDISISCFVLALFALRLYIQLLIVFFVLARNRDLLKASEELRNIADDVRRFDGYERPEKDVDRMV